MIDYVWRRPEALFGKKDFQLLSMPSSALELKYSPKTKPWIKVLIALLIEKPELLKRIFITQ
jgi:hypothetical protein